MKRLLVLLLISTIAYAIVEESNEYEDVSLEISLKPLTNIASKAKGPINKALKPLAKPIIKAVDKGRKVVNKISKPVVKPIQKMVNQGQKVVQKQVIKPIQKIVDKGRKAVQKQVVKPIQGIVHKGEKEIQKKVVKPIQNVVKKEEKKLKNNIVQKVVKPSINTIKKFEKPIEKKIKQMIDPTIKHIKKFLKDHPKIKKLSDPLIKEIKKVVKDPKKPIEEILKDPKNAQKYVGKALKPIIDRVKAFHPFQKIKAELKNLENFMEKNKIPIKEIKKLFGDKANKAINAIKQLPQKARNGIYWLKKKGYWEPIKFVAEQAGQYAATALCSMYLTPAICEPAMDIVFTFVVDKYLDSL